MSKPIVTIEMEDGQIMRGELYPEKAPNTVNNFIALANSGYYDGLTLSGGSFPEMVLRKMISSTP